MAYLTTKVYDETKAYEGKFKRLENNYYSIHYEIPTLRRDITEMKHNIEENISSTKRNVEEFPKLCEENIKIQEEIKKLHLLVQEINKDKDDIRVGIGVLRKHIINLKSKVDFVENKLCDNMKDVVNLETAFVKERPKSCRFRKTSIFDYK